MVEWGDMVVHMRWWGHMFAKHEVGGGVKNTKLSHCGSVSGAPYKAAAAGDGA
jgi:hypothetical protein